MRNSSELQDHFSELYDQTAAVRLEFLRTEIGMAMTFVNVARTTHNPETAERNRDHVREAYATVLRTMTPEDEPAIREGLALLKDIVDSL